MLLLVKRFGNQSTFGRAAMEIEGPVV